MKTLKENWKNHEFSRCYLFFGEETYLIREYEAALRKAILPDGAEMMNEDSFKPDPNELGRVRCFIHKQKEVLAWAHELGYTCSFSNVEYVTDVDGKSIPTIYSRIRR